MALVAHPHPVLGGTAGHKVPAMLAKGLCEAGWLTVRPSFRGVGQTEGVHDHGNGETDDLIAIARRMRAEHPALPLALVGFSFGGFVQIQVCHRLAEAGEPVSRLVVVGLGLGKVNGSRDYPARAVPPDTLVVHGECDTRVPITTILRWAESQSVAVVTVAGADHFFSKRLPILSRFVCAHLASVPYSAST